MINEEYVNDSIAVEFNFMEEYESFNESCKNEINNMFANFGIIHEKVMLESAIMDCVPEQMMMVYESEKKNIFGKIGEMIIKIFNKISETISKFINSFKKTAFEKMTDIEKLEVAVKKRPELQNEMIEAYKLGALDLSDVKSLKELDSAFDEILKMARKQDVDPNTLKGKWEKAKEKFEKSEKTWKIVGTVAGTTASVITVIKLLKSRKADMAKIKTAEIENQEDIRRLQANALDYLDDYNSKVTNDAEKVVDTKNMGIAQLMVTISRELAGKHHLVLNNHKNYLAKFVETIAKLSDKVFDSKRTHAESLRTNLKNQSRKDMIEDSKNIKKDTDKALAIDKAKKAQQP